MHPFAKPGWRAGRPVRSGLCRALMVLGAGLLAPVALAQLKPALPSASELKKLSLDQLMDIEVTSVSKHPEKLSEVASAVQVVTGEDIRRAGAGNLPEALRLAANLEVAQIDARQWAITARGFNNQFADKMLVLIDGRTVYTPLYAGVYWDVQDTMLEDLDRIEVISGPGATQWGANAVNGVINITTRSAQDTQGALVTGTAGAQLQSGAIRYGGTTGAGTAYRVYGKTTWHAESLRMNGTGADDGWRMSQGGFRVDTEAGAGGQFTAQGDFYSGKFGRTVSDDVDVTGHNLLGRWSRGLAGGGDVKLQVYYDHTHRRIPGSFTQTLDTYDVDFQHRLPVPSSAQELIWGLAYRLVDDDIINTPANAFLPAQVSRKTISAFVQDEVTLLDNHLHLTFGAKGEHNDYTGFEFQPSVRAAWTPDQKRTLWAAVSRALRTPSRIDRDLFSPAEPPYRVAGGPNVVSEKLLAYELGYRQQLTPRLTLALAGFYNSYDDLRSLEALNPPIQFPVERSSGLQGHTAGAELTLEWRAAADWRLFAGYTELRVHTEPQPGSTTTGGGRNIARDPNHQLILRSLLNLGERWELDVTGRYVASIKSQSVPGYAEADLRLGWNPGAGWNLSIVGKNLLHARHGEFNSPGGRREIERSVQGQAVWRF